MTASAPTDPDGRQNHQPGQAGQVEEVGQELHFKKVAGQKPACHTREEQSCQRGEQADQGVLDRLDDADLGLPCTERPQDDRFPGSLLPADGDGAAEDDEPCQDAEGGHKLNGYSNFAQKFLNALQGYRDVDGRGAGKFQSYLLPEVDQLFFAGGIDRGCIKLDRYRNSDQQLLDALHGYLDVDGRDVGKFQSYLLLEVHQLSFAAGLDRGCIKLGGRFQYTCWKENEKVRLRPLKIDLPNAPDDGCDRDSLHVETKGIANGELQILLYIGIQGDRNEAADSLGFRRPFAFQHSLRRGEGIPVGDPVLPAQGPPADIERRIFADLLKGHPVAAGEPHRDNRHILYDPVSSGGCELIHTHVLIILYIVEDQVREIFTRLQIDPLHQHILREVERTDQQHAHPEGGDQQGGLIVGPEEVGHSLPKRVGQAVQFEGADQAGESV